MPVNFKISSPTLLRSDEAQIVRGDEAEIGISFDKSSVKHFFIVGRAPYSQKFTIKFNVWPLI